MNDKPPKRRQARPSLDVIFPILAPEVMLLAVTLDRNLQLGKREIDPCHELALLILDDELTLRHRKASSIQKLNESPFEGTPRHRSLQFARIEDCTKHLYARPTSASKSIQYLAQRSFSHQSAPTSLIQRKLEPVQRHAASQIDNRSHRCCGAHPIDHSEVSLLQLFDAVDNHAIAWCLQ